MVQEARVDDGDESWWDWLLRLHYVDTYFMLLD